MKFKLASIILILYAFIGFAITTDLEFESKLVFANCLMLFVIMPSLCGYGLWLRKKTAIAVSLVLFIFMSVRRVGEGAMLPHIAPITFSLPIGDFANGQGYLIDVFAIIMVIYIGWLFKTVFKK